jgi:hypothetical protein
LYLREFVLDDVVALPLTTLVKLAAWNGGGALTF